MKPNVYILIVFLNEFPPHREAVIYGFFFIAEHLATVCDKGAMFKQHFHGNDDIIRRSSWSISKKDREKLDEILRVLLINLEKTNFVFFFQCLHRTFRRKYSSNHHNLNQVMELQVPIRKLSKFTEQSRSKASNRYSTLRYSSLLKALFGFLIWSLLWLLTDNVQSIRLADFWLCGNLTLWVRTKVE